MSGAGAFARGMAGGYTFVNDARDRKALREALVTGGGPRTVMDYLGENERGAATGGGAASAGLLGTFGGGVDASADVLNQGAPASWEQIQAGIFAGESGGDYDALFNFSNRGGEEFSDIKLTNMTVDQAIAFSDPNGPYAQWVKSKIGRVATPMGGYQIVGKTLRGLKEDMGLKGNERMSPALQDAMGKHILRTQGTGAWEGYKGPQAPKARSVVPASEATQPDRSNVIPLDASTMPRPVPRSIATGAPVGTYNLYGTGPR